MEKEEVPETQDKQRDGHHTTKNTSSSSRASDKDPVSRIISSTRSFHLGIAGGVVLPKKESPTDLPQYSNIQMWSLEDLYTLRSELIQFKSFLDILDMETTASYTDALRSMQSSMEEKQMERPVRRVRFNRVSETKQIEEEKIEETSEQTPSHRKNTDRKALSSEHHSKNKYKDQIELLNEPKPLTPDTLWETTDRFFKTIKNVSVFDKLLVPSKDRIDTSRLSEPLGTHYSLTLPKTSAFLSDPLKASLKLPPPPFSAGGTASKDGTNHLHRRLISAIVFLDTPGATVAPPSEGSVDAHLEKRVHVIPSRALERSDRRTVPLAPRLGSSAYGALSFEQRLQYEFASLGIVSEGAAVVDMNYPVVMDLNAAVNQQREIIDRCNTFKQLVQHELIDGGQRLFQERLKRQQNWNRALNLFLQQEEGRKKRSKERGKRNTSEEDTGDIISYSD